MDHNFLRIRSYFVNIKHHISVLSALEIFCGLKKETDNVYQRVGQWYCGNVIEYHTFITFHERPIFILCPILFTLGPTDLTLRSTGIVCLKQKLEMVE